MSRVDDAKDILRHLGFPRRQQNDNAAYTLLAFAEVGPDDPWSSAQAVRTNPHGVIEFARSVYGKDYAENTRETIRRQAIHQFVQAGLLLRNPDEPDLPTNSPNTHYALSDEALTAIRHYGTDSFEKAADVFLEASKGGLAVAYAKERELRLVDVTLTSGEGVVLSPGAHNELQRDIIEQFLPRFAPGSVVLYLGDTDKKTLHLEQETLAKLGVLFDEHNRMPDVVAYDRDRNWLFLCEAVTSHGPVSPKRQLELEEDFEGCSASRVYVSAFPDFGEFKKHAASIAWETEVWIREVPDHILHFDGERFMASLD